MRAKEISIKYLLLLYITIYLVIVLIQQEYIVLPHLLQMDIIGDESKVRVIENFNRTRWWAYLASPIMICIRLSLVSICLYIGTFFFPYMSGTKYVDCWRLAVKSQIVFVLYSIMVCVVNIYFGEDMVNQILYHTSLIFCGGDDAEPWIKMPLTAINIFEIAYWILMSLFVKNYAGTKFGQSFKFVLSTYGVGYLFYIAFLMFLLLYLI